MFSLQSLAFVEEFSHVTRMEELLTTVMTDVFYSVIVHKKNKLIE